MKAAAYYVKLTNCWPRIQHLLDRAPLGAGEVAIDLGCGPRGILELLSDRVGPSGRVVGVDTDPRHVAMAAEMVATRKLGNVEVVLGDARNTGLASSSFDVVHARTLLVNVPQPLDVVAEMVRLTKPGGWVLSVRARLRIIGLLPSSSRLRAARRHVRPGLHTQRGRLANRTTGS